MGNGITKYPSQLKSYLRGKNENKTNWNIWVAMYINRYYNSILHAKEIFSILSNLQTNLVRIDLPKMTDIGGKWLIHDFKHR